MPLSSVYTEWVANASNPYANGSEIILMMDYMNIPRWIFRKAPNRLLLLVLSAMQLIFCEIRRPVDLRLPALENGTLCQAPKRTKTLGFIRSWVAGMVVLTDFASIVNGPGRARVLLSPSPKTYWELVSPAIAGDDHA